MSNKTAPVVTEVDWQILRHVIQEYTGSESMRLRAMYAAAKLKRIADGHNMPQGTELINGNSSDLEIKEVLRRLGVM